MPGDDGAHVEFYVHMTSHGKKLIELFFLLFVDIARKMGDL